MPLVVEVNAPCGAMTDSQWQTLLDDVRLAVAIAMCTPLEPVHFSQVDVRETLRPLGSSRSASLVWVTVRAIDTSDRMANLPERLAAIKLYMEARIPSRVVPESMQPLSVLFAPTPGRFWA